MNIRHVVFNCLNVNMDNAFMVSDDPESTIKSQQHTDAPHQQPSLFKMIFYSPQDAPEVLFRRIEACQEVQILGEVPYMAQHLLKNAVRLLLQCQLYIRDFED